MHRHKSEVCEDTVAHLGKAIPFGVYDLSANDGWVSVGVDHDTAAFARLRPVRRPEFAHAVTPAYLLAPTLAGARVTIGPHATSGGSPRPSIRPRPMFKSSSTHTAQV